MNCNLYWSAFYFLFPNFCLCVFHVRICNGLVGDLHGDLAKARCALELAGVLSPDGQDLWTGEETVCLRGLQVAK